MVPGNRQAVLPHAGGSARSESGVCVAVTLFVTACVRVRVRVCTCVCTCTISGQSLCFMTIQQIPRLPHAVATPVQSPSPSHLTHRLVLLPAAQMSHCRCLRNASRSSRNESRDTSSFSTPRHFPSSPQMSLCLPDNKARPPDETLFEAIF